MLRGLFSLERRSTAYHSSDMAKLAKKSTAKGSEVHGRTREGLPVWKPSVRPKNFTVSQLERAVREAKRHEMSARKAG